MSATRKSGARSGPSGGNGVPGSLDVERALAGRRILFTGATGFVGKVTLSLLLHRYPGVGRITVLVRPGTAGTAEARFWDKVARARPFDPLREQYGDRFEAFLREKCQPVAGDVSDPLLGIAAADLDAMGPVDLVVNCAGLVDFNPSLELALGVNLRGPANAAEICRRTGAALLHVSTCFVAGNRDGLVYEDEPVPGYFPRRQGVAGRPKEAELDARDFDLDRELADCEKQIARIREEAEDTAMVSLLRERARERLRAEGRAADLRAERLAVGRETRLWISQRLVDLGMDRARHWGWPNTYVYTKSLGEQAIARSGIRFAIARPSIVETALRYPFPGWNEGFTTSAPLAFLGLKGQRVYPMGEKAVLDLVPVDLVAAGIVAIAAECVAGDPRPVYHLASSDRNPFRGRRAVELTGLYRRRFYRERKEGSRLANEFRARFEPYSVSKSHYRTFSAPAFARLAREGARLLRERGPKWGAPRLSALAGTLARELDEIESKAGQVQALFDLFLPFLWDNRYVFRCANVRELHSRLAPRDREKLPWDPEAIDWRRYWLEVHMVGLEEWVFPGLEEEAKKKVHAVKQHRDLLEMLEATCQAHRNRVALRMAGERKERFSYGELREWAGRTALFLRGAGIRKGDRVLLACENRPEWAVAYFGILLAGGVAVPVDAQLAAEELENLARSSGAAVAILSEQTAERVGELAAGWRNGALPRLALLPEALAGGAAAELPRGAAPDDLASIIYTSGTTGRPKGVMLTHRNFASLVAKLAGIFDLGPGDGLLSVLPLHHTFEFTCGLLVPLSRGAEIEYLDELTGDRLTEALEGGRITAMIGVPALWALLHRRITQEIAARPGFVEQAFQALRKANAKLREETDLNLGKLLLWPVHRRLGGRLRILVSGGSALSPEVQQAFHEMGFDLYEGYGLTEAAPVLSVSTPADGPSRGTVGRPLPGIEIRILEADASGVGEVLARGPNVMAGYFRPAEGGGAEVDPDLTGPVLRDGWLHTGDLGRIDAGGNLLLVGRLKDVIIDADGKNVYPDELEEIYRADGLIAELSIVGLPDGAGEKVAMLLVPDWKDRPRDEVLRLVGEHLRAVSARLPFHKRVKVWHWTDTALDRTSTRKVKRGRVVEELLRLEAAARRGKKHREAAAGGREGWLLDLVAEVSRRPRAEVSEQALLASDLGFDSLMLSELAAALEHAGVPASATESLHQVQTVGELWRLVGSAVHRPEDGPVEPSRREVTRPGEIEIPRPVASLGRRLLGAGQQALYRGWMETEVSGRAFVPRDRNFLVVANHASHLDMGLVKIALGEQGRKLAALAARDYFFDTPLKRAYFGNFTNLIPMDREGSIRRSLRAAVEALGRGYNLLVFPEGTRSRDGRMAAFKPTAGYLALHCGVDALPVYLHGTHEALPVGKAFPRKAKLRVVIGQPIRVEDLRRRTAALARGDAHKAATQIMEDAVRALRRSVVPDAPAAAHTDSPPPSPPQGGGDGERPDHASPTPIATSTPTSIATGTPTATSTGPVSAKGSDP